MSRARDHSLTTEIRWTRCEHGTAAQGTAAGWSTLEAVPASSTLSRCDGAKSAPMGAARQDAGHEQRI